MKEKDKQDVEKGREEKGEEQRMNTIQIYDILEINCYHETNSVRREYTTRCVFQISAQFLIQVTIGLMGSQLFTFKMLSYIEERSRSPKNA